MKKTERIQLRLSPLESLTLRKLAQEQKTTMTGVIRNYLEAARKQPLKGSHV
jgi:hypothetical protein